MMLQKSALFLDRDGVIIEDVDLLVSPSQISPIFGIDKLIGFYRQKNFLIIVITNQAVVARGLLSLSDLEKIHEEIKSKISGIDDFFVCPHHPNANIVQFRSHCNCRKPKPGLILEAAKKYNIDLAKSLMIGDRLSDVVAANLAGCESILLGGANSKKPFIETDLIMTEELMKPKRVINSLLDLVL